MPISPLEPRLPPDENKPLINRLTELLRGLMAGAYGPEGMFLPDVFEPLPPNSGGRLFVQGGALKYIGSNGTITTIAPA